MNNETVPQRSTADASGSKAASGSEAVQPVNKPHTVIIGGGPAGLTAAWELQSQGLTVQVFEKDHLVGGISRTDNYKGYRYDIGGHRFFSKSVVVRDWWQMMLSDQFLTRPRLSRIYYQNKFFDYPLKAMNALMGLGLWEATRCVLSYVKAQLLPIKEEKNLQDWVSNRFGSRLFQIFFKTYTEKVWGIPCTELSADWAAQRIKNLNLFVAVKNALVGNLGKGPVVTSLIDEFHYPRLGPGQMWERVTSRLTERGVEVKLNTRVKKIHHSGGKVTGVTVETAGQDQFIAGDEFISSMPMGELITAFDPPAPAAILQAASGLKYRDFLTVGLIINQADTFPDNWIYVHSPGVKVGRIQNFRAWSPDMIPNPEHSSLGLEYFVQEGDELWTMADADLVELGRKEMAELGLVKPETVIDGCVIRMPKAYPVYDDEYKKRIRQIRDYLEQVGPNIQLVGRNGQHRYNNQDHSMLTAIFAARNISSSTNPEYERIDIWSVNTEQEYHEESAATDAKEGTAATRPSLFPGSDARDPRVLAIEATLARYDAFALGMASAVVFGGVLFLATAVLLLKGGEVVGPNLALLANYFAGYEVSWLGAFIGLLEGSVAGFFLGWLIATMNNFAVAAHERRILGLATLNSAMEVAAGD
jgi:protoporphyrinogen oxidase